MRQAGCSSFGMFELSASRRRRWRSILVSIGIHTFAVLAFWQTKVFQRTFSGIQVVHASGIKPVWLPLKNAEPTLYEYPLARPDPETRVPRSIQIPSGEDHSAIGAAMIPQESPEPVMGTPPEEDSKSAETTAYGSRPGRRMEPAHLLKQTLPVYPALGKTARIQGVVVLEATITESGAVENVTVISGHPLLVEAALDAVRQWRYVPARLNGVAVPSSVSISVNFKLEFQ